MRSVPLQRRVSVDGPTGGIPQPSPALRNKMEQLRRLIANPQGEIDIQRAIRLMSPGRLIGMNRSTSTTFLYGES